MKASLHKKSSPSSVVSTSSTEESGNKHNQVDQKKQQRDVARKESNNANSVLLRKRTSLRRCESRSKPAPTTRAFVEHHYHDHSRDPLAKTVELVGGGGARSSSDNSVMSRSFPEKLQLLLDTMAEEGLEHIVSWQPHGRCFAIHDKNEFVGSVMPRFFMQTKLTSFQRQLNLYGFIRLTAGQDRGGYYHEFFLRGRADLCKFMVRTRVKGIGMKAASSPATEPNFYLYPSCPVVNDGSFLKNAQQDQNDDDDDDESAVSDTTEPHGNTNASPFDDDAACMTTSSMPPNIVSPPESPVMSSNTVFVQGVPDLLPFLDVATGAATTTTKEAAASMQMVGAMPHTGDEVFFEGLKFRYLDHLDLDDVQQEINVTNVEYL